MKKAALFLACATLGAGPALSQREAPVAEQRAAVAAWATCIADENTDTARDLLVRDYRSDGYKLGMKALAQTRVSQECFDAMPRRYRQMRLGGLPFAGGLAERLIEQDAEPLLTRLSMAVIGPEAETFSYTDEVAMCAVRGAPDIVARLFATEVETPDEQASFAALAPVVAYCTKDRTPVEASPLAMRSMLATASFRLLAAQTDDADA